MTTARDLCTDAIKESGALGVGQTALAEDMDDAFTRLQRMVALWQKKRWLVPSLQRYSFQADGSESYTVGIGGVINVKRPSDIKGAYVVQRNTGSNAISLGLTKIFSYEDYITIAVKNLNSLPDHFFYDAQFPLAHFYAWPIPSNQYDLHILFESQLGFGSTIADGAISAGGTLYTNGNYKSVALTGGSGTGATADIGVNGNAVTIVTLDSGGEDYQIGDILSAAAGDIGGTGSGFTWTVADTTANLDSEIIMPPEYEEPLMYNLALRVCSMYQVQAEAETKQLAKASLATLRQVNTQVPALFMPVIPGVNPGRAFSLWNPDGY